MKNNFLPPKSQFGTKEFKESIIEESEFTGSKQSDEISKAMKSSANFGGVDQ